MPEQIMTQVERGLPQALEQGAGVALALVDQRGRNLRITPVAAGEEKNDGLELFKFILGHFGFSLEGDFLAVVGGKGHQFYDAVHVRPKGILALGVLALEQDPTRWEEFLRDLATRSASHGLKPELVVYDGGKLAVVFKVRGFHSDSFNPDGDRITSRDTYQNLGWNSTKVRVNQPHGARPHAVTEESYSR